MSPFLVFLLFSLIVFIIQMKDTYMFVRDCISGDGFYWAMAAQWWLRRAKHSCWVDNKLFDWNAVNYSTQIFELCAHGSEYIKLASNLGRPFN